MNGIHETGEPGVTSSGAPVRVACVALTVRNMDAVTAFYRDVVGLRVLGEDGETRTLGAGSTPLLDLRHDRAARRDDPRLAGLFHTAFLLPRRADLADWITHAMKSGVRLEGASDHLVSEALYLSDPEGNGVEIYADRPSETWGRRDGMVEMATEALDVDDLLMSGSGTWTGAPDGAVVGHVHLRVGDLDQAEDFYARTLGLAVECRYPGATFFGSGGYHHHIAGNVWRSRGAPTRAEGATGLAEVRLTAETSELEKIRARLRITASGAAPLHDPWGTSIVVGPR